MDPGGSDSFESQTRTLVELSVRDTVTALERNGAAGGGGAAADSLTQILRDLSRDLTDKITELHRDSTSTLLRENRALRAEVRQLEAELKGSITAGLRLERTLRSQVSRLRREVTHLDRDLKRVRERGERTRELLQRDTRTLTGPVHVLLQGGSVLGSPVVSLYTSQTVADPAALSGAILSSAAAAGQTSARPSAPLMVTSQPLPGLTSVPLSLNVTAAVPAGEQTSQSPLHTPVLAASQPASNLTANSQQSLNLHTGSAAEGPPASRAEDNKPADPTEVSSQPQETVTKLSEDKPEDAGGKSADLRNSDSEEKNKRKKEKQKQKRVFCEKCSRGFHYRHQLKQHMSCHDEPFSCEQCDRRFHKEKTFHTHLHAHKVTLTTEKKMWPCSHIQKNLDAHLSRHEIQKSFKCSICEKTYGKIHLLRRYEAIHARVRPFICDACGKGFATKSVLQEHRSIHTGERPFTCSTCGRSFRTSAHLFSHGRVHSEERPFRCSDCGKTFKLKRALLQHRVVHTQEKAFVCQTCGIGFGLKNNLQRHLRVHTGEKPFRCRDCGEEFSGSCAFKTHMLLHGAKKPFMCDLCGKTFFYNSKLLEHKRAVHLGREDAPSPQRGDKTRPRLFTCTFCDKGFSSVESLRVHKESHAEDDKFICATCGKCFHRKCTFVYHMRRHGEEKLNSCSVCGKRFVQPSRLKEHMTLHTGEKRYTCEQCGRAFRTRNNFYRHARLHRGERPYECQVCGSKFSQSNQLKSHMQIHTGVKLYVCERCARGFSDSRQLKKHRCGDAVQKPVLDTGEG